MERYRDSTPRTACALAALAMSALTVAVLVIGPARMERNAGNAALAAARAGDKVATEVTIEPRRIDVVGVREGTRTVAQSAGLQPVRAEVEGEPRIARVAR